MFQWVFSCVSPLDVSYWTSLSLSQLHRLCIFTYNVGVFRLHKGKNSRAHAS